MVKFELMADCYRTHNGLYDDMRFLNTAFPEEGVPVEVHQALQTAMNKLQQRFTSLMQEKADLKERVEELEHRCIQLSGETDTIGENSSSKLRFTVR